MGTCRAVPDEEAHAVRDAAGHVVQRMVDRAVQSEEGHVVQDGEEHAV